MELGNGKLQRTDDGIIAGVCSGLAECLSLDVGVLRFAFVALALVSAGTFVIGYVVLWLILPASPAEGRAVDVRPDAPSDADPPAAEADSKVRRRIDAANEPPVPPPAPGVEEVREPFDTTGFVVIALMVGIIAVVVFFCVVLSLFFPVFSPIQFWPLGVVAPGIVRMVIPGREGYRMDAFFDGAMFILMGIVLLLNTTGAVSMNGFAWIKQCWPLLMMAFGCVIIWKATGLAGFAVAALLLLAGFCVAGVAFCSVPGPAGFLAGKVGLGSSFVEFGVW